MCGIPCEVRRIATSAPSRPGRLLNCAASAAAGALSAPRATARQRALLHPERTLRLSAEELAHELVVGVEQLARRARLHDAALPQHRDEVGHAAGGHDVVGY